MSELTTRAHVHRRTAEAELAISELIEDLVFDLHGIVPGAQLDRTIRALLQRVDSMVTPPLALPAPAEPALAAPAPEPAPAPAAPAPAPAPARKATPSLPTAKAKPLSDAERDLALAALARGETAAEIAYALKRSKMGFHFTLAALERGAAREDEATPAVPEPAPAAKPAPVRVPSAPTPPPDGRSPAERAVLARLEEADRAVPMADWGVECDLHLVTLLAAGEGVAAVVDALEIPRDRAIARWNALCPEKSIEAQALLLKVLRAQAGE